MKPYVGTILLIMLSINPWQICQGQDMLLDTATATFVDSLGNPITRKQAFDLMKTGKYVAVPRMNGVLNLNFNGLMIPELLIRRRTADDDGKYQSYSSNDIVISTFGMKDVKFKYNLGDTLPVFTVQNFLGNHFTVHDGSGSRKNLIVFRTKDDLNSDDIKRHYKQFISHFQNVNLIICSPGGRLMDFFDKKTLLNSNNIFIANTGFPKVREVEEYPFYLVTTNLGKLLIFTDPRPQEASAIAAIINFLAAFPD